MRCGRICSFFSPPPKAQEDWDFCVMTTNCSSEVSLSQSGMAGTLVAARSRNRRPCDKNAIDSSGGLQNLAPRSHALVNPGKDY